MVLEISEVFTIINNNGFTVIKLTHNATSFTINDSYFMNNIFHFLGFKNYLK